MRSCNLARFLDVPEKSKERALILGGSGFLGSHVADRLSDLGYAVTVYDLVKSPFLRPDQEMIVGDILDLEALTQAAQNCAYVYNFAGISDLDDAKEKPIDTVRMNVLGNVNALEAARRAKAKRYIFASTVYVYSSSGSFYRASKQACEKYVETYFQQFGLSYTIVRYGSLYGRRADKHNGIYNMIRQALVDKKIIYKGSPESMREYIHVKDAAKLSVGILEPQYANQHIILTGHERMTVKSLMKMIAEMVSSDVALQFEASDQEWHYTMSPYSFTPPFAHKLIAQDYVDIGQGLLDCVGSTYAEIYGQNYSDGEIVLHEREL